MKNSAMKSVFFILIFILSAIIAQAQVGIVGTWQGKLQLAGLRLVLHFESDASGKLSAKMDSPDQGAEGIPCSNVSLTGGAVHWEVPAAGIVYDGKLADPAHINGTMTQGNRPFEMNLVKGDKPEVPKRPQTPTPPFSYNIEDVIYLNEDGSIQYGATVTSPKGKGPFPAVLLITGSGLQNRDEEIMDHKPFAVIADYLTKRGYVVMRVDDRTKGRSTGDVANATTADFAKDVSISYKYLLGRREVNPKKAGLLGHSEGGQIAEMLAAERKDIDFIVLMAAPGEKIERLMSEQNEALLRSEGVPDSATRKYMGLYDELEQIIVNTKDAATVQDKISDAVHKWRVSTSADIVANTAGIRDNETEKGFVNSFVAMATNPWVKYFISSDPRYSIEQISCKVLALNGSKDIQVVAAGNLQGLRESLAKSKSKNYEVKELPGLNHLFQECKECTIDEYGKLEQTISPVALKTIGDWLDKNVK